MRRAGETIKDRRHFRGYVRFAVQQLRPLLQERLDGLPRSVAFLLERHTMCLPFLQLVLMANERSFSDGLGVGKGCFEIVELLHRFAEYAFQGRRVRWGRGGMWRLGLRRR